MNLKRSNLNLKGNSLGSKLKSSELKAPDFLVDFYYDLRDRRLLPLVALVVVAIAAVPFLLGDDGEGPALPAPAPEAGTAGTAADGFELTVVESAPGLRDYRKRLHGSPTDPFVQRYTGVPSTSQLKSIGTESAVETGTGGDSEALGGSGGESVTTPESSSGTVADGGSSPGGSGGAPSGGGSDGGATARPYELVIDVQISRTEKTADGKEKTGEVEVRKNVPVLTQLPGKKTPVVTTMGANFSKERLLFLVSHQVKAISGEYACVTRGEVCELLEVELGMLLEFVYEPSGARYAIKVTRVDAIPAREGRGARSSRAVLGRSQPDVAFDTGSGSVSKIAQTQVDPR